MPENFHEINLLLQHTRTHIYRFFILTSFNDLLSTKTRSRFVTSQWLPF